MEEAKALLGQRFAEKQWLHLEEILQALCYICDGLGPFLLALLGLVDQLIEVLVQHCLLFIISQVVEMRMLFVA